MEENQAWEIIGEIATKEEDKCRSERNKDPAHKMNDLKSPVVSLLCLDANALQPNPGDNGTEEFEEYIQDHPDLFKNYIYKDNLPIWPTSQLGCNQCIS